MATRVSCDSLLVPVKMTLASMIANSPPPTPSTLSSSVSLPLQCSWSFWYLIRHTRNAVQSTNYENNLHLIGTVTTAEEFWAVQGHMRRPAELPTNSDYQLFRTGVKPAWEDPANERGGKWILRLRKGIAGRLWEHLILAMISGVFEDCGVCGAVLSVRYAEDIISLWNRTAEDGDEKQRLQERLRQVLFLPSNSLVEYKAHDVAMKDSTLRNVEKPTTKGN